MQLVNHGQQLGDSIDWVSVAEAIPGVTDAADLVQQKVKDTVRPYVLASLLLGLIGATFGFAAFIGMRSIKNARG